jgi:hypothetical protein
MVARPKKFRERIWRVVDSAEFWDDNREDSSPLVAGYLRISDLVRTDTFAVVLEQEVRRVLGDEFAVAFSSCSGEYPSRRESVPLEDGLVISKSLRPAIRAQIGDLGALSRPLAEFGGRTTYRYVRRVTSHTGVSVVPHLPDALLAGAAHRAGMHSYGPV